MIINPLMAAAVAVANTNTATTMMMMSHSASSNNNINEYFTEIENYNHHNDDDIHRQKSELDEFIMSHTASAESNASAETAATTQPPSPPPPLPDTNSPYRLLGLTPGADFNDVRCAYKSLAKVYHPDAVIVGRLDLDSSDNVSLDERRKSASWDFARVNAAYNILKRTHDEEQEASQSSRYNTVVNHDSSEKPSVKSESRYQRDDGDLPRYPTANNNNYDLTVRHNNQHQPMRTTWRERHESSHPPSSRSSMHNSSNDAYAVSKHSPGKWKTGAHVLDHEDYNWQMPRENENQFYESSSSNSNKHSIVSSSSGHGNEKKWGGEEKVERQQQQRSRSSTGTYSTNGFGIVNPRQGQWWNDGQQPAVVNHGEHQPAGDNHHDRYPTRDSQRFSTKIKQGYPYKDRLGYGTSRPTKSFREGDNGENNFRRMDDRGGFGGIIGP